MRTLLILAGLVLLLLIIRFFYRQKSPDLKKLGRNLAIGLAATVFLILLLTGRLHWLFAVIAAAVPVVMRMLPLLRYVPLLKGLYNRYQQKHPGTAGSASAQSSSVRSQFILMTLNHDSGEIDGEVLQGQYAGKQLHELSIEQLFQLLQECQSDNESVSLLVAYLDRVHPDWRDKADAASSSSTNDYSQSSNEMSVDEAYEILGLQSGASKDEIKKAHRKLMQKLHPDHGGSTYLSAKINLAKDTLLKKL